MAEKESKITSQVRAWLNWNDLNFENILQARCIISWRKAVFGILVLILVTCFWVGATQFLKQTYNEPVTNFRQAPPNSSFCRDKEVKIWQRISQQKLNFLLFSLLLRSLVVGSAQGGQACSFLSTLSLKYLAAISPTASATTSTITILISVSLFCSPTLRLRIVLIFL